MSSAPRSLWLAATAGIYRFAWALWFGGSLILGAVVAPAVFGLARQWNPTADTDPLDLVRGFAGQAMGEAFGRFNWVALVCGAVMVAAAAMGAAGNRPARKLWVAQLLLTAAPWAITLYLTLGLYPAMLHLRSAGDWAAFDALHRQYVAWTSGQFWFLLGAGCLANFRRPGMPRDEAAAARGPDTAARREVHIHAG